MNYSPDNTPTQMATYAIGTIHSKAHRILKKTTAAILVSWDITPLDWAILGALFEKPSHMNITEIAQYLAVENPLVTRRINSLILKGFVQKVSFTTDLRFKVVMLTVEGKRIVEVIEPILRSDMKKLLGGISSVDYSGYIRVLLAISNLERR